MHTCDHPVGRLQDDLIELEGSPEKQAQEAGDTKNGKDTQGGPQGGCQGDFVG